MRYRFRDPVLARMAAIAADLGADMSGFPKGGSSFVQATSLQAAFVAANESSVSTAYTDLTTVGPSVSVPIGPQGVLVVFLSSTYTNAQGTACFMAPALSGNNTVAAADANAMEGIVIASGSQIQTTGATVVLTGLSTGATTVKAQYKVSGSTGHWQNRYLACITY